MDQTNRTIYNLIKASLFGAEIPIVQINWEELKEELDAHTITGIPLEYMVANCDLAPDVQNQINMLAFAQVGVWTKLMEAQKQLIELFDANQIKMAIIKGIVAGKNYPKPEYRGMGDVDFFVPKNDFYAAYELMKANGYVPACDEYLAEQELKSDKYHHVELTKDGIIFELHKSLAPSGSNERLAELQQRIENSFDQIEVVEVQGYKIPMFPEEINGLIFLRHIVQHLVEGKGIGLRHILDWMMYADKYVDDEQWNGSFRQAVAGIGLEDFAITITRMCQMYLGLPEDNRTWSAAADEELATSVLEIIMEAGNFGRKNAQQDEGANVLYKNKNIWTMIKSLQVLGIRNCKACREHKLLRPFAWLYQIGRYIRKGLGRKSPIKSLKADMNKSRGKKDVMQRLNIQ